MSGGTQLEEAQEQEEQLGEQLQQLQDRSDDLYDALEEAPSGRAAQKIERDVEKASAQVLGGLHVMHARQLGPLALHRTVCRPRRPCITRPRKLRRRGGICFRQIALATSLVPLTPGNPSNPLRRLLHGQLTISVHCLPAKESTSCPPLSSHPSYRAEHLARPSPCTPASDEEWPTARRPWAVRAAQTEAVREKVDFARRQQQAAKAVLQAARAAAKQRDAFSLEEVRAASAAPRHPSHAPAVICHLQQAWQLAGPGLTASLHVKLGRYRSAW